MKNKGEDLYFLGVDPVWLFSIDGKFVELNDSGVVKMTPELSDYLVKKNNLKNSEGKLLEWKLKPYSRIGFGHGFYPLLLINSRKKDI